TPLDGTRPSGHGPAGERRSALYPSVICSSPTLLPHLDTHPSHRRRHTHRCDVRPPDPLQSAWPAVVEAAGVRHLRRPHEGAHRGDPARLSRHRVAVPRPRVTRLPDETRRPGLRPHPDGRVAGKRVHDPRPPSCPCCPPQPAPHPAPQTPARQLRLARAAPPPGSPLRHRRPTRRPHPPRLPHLHRPHPQPPHPATLARRTPLAQPPSVTSRARESRVVSSAIVAVKPCRNVCPPTGPISPEQNMPASGIGPSSSATAPASWSGSAYMFEPRPLQAKSSAACGRSPFSAWLRSAARRSASALSASRAWKRNVCPTRTVSPTTSEPWSASPPITARIR